MSRRLPLGERANPRPTIRLRVCCSTTAVVYERAAKYVGCDAAQSKQRLVKCWSYGVGCLLRGTGKEDVERGQVLAKPGSITPHTKFKAQAYILTKDEGGRHTPFFQGYRPQFYFRTTDVTGQCELPADVEMVMPGDNVNLKARLIVPIAMEEGLRFAVREGGRTVGAGVVTKIIE